MSSIAEVIAQIASGTKRVTLGGMAGSSGAYLLSRLIREGPSSPYLFLGVDGKEAVRFQRDLEFYLGPSAKGKVLSFPAPDVLPFSQLSPHNDITCTRLKTLYALTQRPAPAVIVTTVAAALPTLPPRSLLENPIILKAGGETDRDLLICSLTERGYQNVPLVLDRGTFAVRGSLLDIFSPLDHCPIRIEWLGDQIESIREFDPSTQRSLQPRDDVTLIPSREIILNDQSIKLFSGKARRLAEDKDIPRPHWAGLVDRVKEKILFPGIETYLSLFYEAPTSLWDWIPEGTMIISSHFANIQDSIREHREEIQTLVKGKTLLVDPDDAELSGEVYQEKLDRFPQVSFSAGERDGMDLQATTHEEIRREIEISKKGPEPLSPLARRIKEWLLTDTVILIASSSAQAHRMNDLLSHYFPHPFPVFEKSFAEVSFEPARAQILIGELSQGFRLPSEHIVLITEEEIFGQKIRRRIREKASAKDFTPFSELKLGDPIVHKAHGIGLYRGLIHMAIEGCVNDYLLIEYRDGDKLYLPVYRMNLVQKYTGVDGVRPRIDKMGGASWAKVRGRSEKIIRELAGELLNLYAARTTNKGFSYSPANDLFEAFEASFPYEETPDQERAIQEVLNDMMKDKPMDRLVLGDVGYGKTEVALRAAFKAAIDGRQTVLLVPTTLLACQHYERFLERFKDYPVTVEMISRFRSAAEQKKILKNAAEGKIDILIGTHRLLQPDVSFKNLGLLVIDEEHRFGVEQKEKVKRLRKNVDCLALSATPIPRTLYMSLVGIRGISVIETPPTDRLSIRTFVMPFEEGVIREAIGREIRRGGQVFFVHNDIDSIGRMRDTLKTLVPEAKIEIGHGRMDEKDLEEVMIRFLHQDFNVLLCTTIIESGIDIPTANTILINQADRFGLSQIYQLRGRVGRGGQRAYAYLLVPGEKTLTKEATERLSVLQRFSDLGVGYNMASYDLEIRGAGNLLGTQQSGQMAAIGYELYTEVLEQAVRELKGEKVLEDIDPELHFRTPSFLPEDYIAEPPVRLELYRRLASLRDEEEVDPIADEMKDRFGPFPTPVENLLELSAIKTHAKKLRIKQIRYDGKRFMYAFDPSSPLPPDLLLERIKKDPKKHKLTPDFRFTIEKTLPEEDRALGEAKKFLRELTLHLT